MKMIYPNLKRSRSQQVMTFMFLLFGLLCSQTSFSKSPPPPLEIHPPYLPASLTCSEAAYYMPPVAYYGNGPGNGPGNANTTVLSSSGGSYDPCKNGVIYPTKEKNWGTCGGYIKVKYSKMVCGKLLTYQKKITVHKAPKPTVTTPYYKPTITCAEAQNFSIGKATYDNGQYGICKIKGNIMPSIQHEWNKCGGVIKVTYLKLDPCGRPLMTNPNPIIINVVKSPPMINTPGVPMMVNCWEADYYYPGNATFSNNLPGVCNNSGTLYPDVKRHYDACGGGWIAVEWSGYDDCYDYIKSPRYVVMVMPDEIAPVGECVTIEQTFQYMDQTPEPDELDFYKDSIASHFWDYCSNVVVKVVGDTGSPVCGLDGKYQRTYDMEVSDGCGNVADTCQVIFSGRCNPLFCTLSQSFYAGQDYPNSIFGYSSLEVIDYLIDHGYDPIQIGTGSCGYLLDDAYCIQTIIGGEGTSTYLPTHNYDVCWQPVNNTLANQVLTTMLNVRYNNILNPNGPLDFGNYQLSATCKNYPPPLLDALPPNPTINDLIDYANVFLGCQCTGVCGDYPEISWDLTCAFLALNSRFHECHIPGPCHLNQDIYDFATPEITGSQLDVYTLLEQRKNNTPDAIDIPKITEGQTKVTLSDAIDIFPNPAKDMLNVQLNTAQANTYRIRIFTSDGKEVLSNHAAMQEGENLKQLNISKLDNGLHMIMIEGNDEVWSERFIKIQ